ncbi:MAG: transglutaminase domain-containing protein [Planctomycetes bacterium]|nr:transglutaminase domain-containing protein [Planctomycetota bacterium]
MKRNFFVSAILFSSLLTSTIFAAPSEETDYMAILLDGHKIGYAIHARKVDGAQVTTTNDMNMLIGRGPTAIRYTGREVNIESIAGKPIAFETIQNISGMEQTRKGTVNNGKIKMILQNGPTSTESTIAYPVGALMAEGLRLLQVKKGLQPGQLYDALLFRPDMAQALPAKVEVGKKTSIDLLGRMRELSEVKINMQVGQQAIVFTEYVDENFMALKSIIPMMGMNLEMIACEKDFALSQDDIVDFLDKLCVASPTPIGSDSFAGPIIYELTATTSKPLLLPNTDTQAVKEITPGRFEVTVGPIQPPSRVKFPYAGKDKEVIKALEATEYLQTKDAKVVDLAKRAVSGTDDVLKAAQKIESFVKGYITKKDMSVGYASAAEVAQTRQGDCTEHAILAAAMCRSAGIPARVVCGLVYTDAIGTKKNVFGAHMWAEVFLDGKWFPIDPTRAPNGFSAGHITLARGDGNPTDFFSLVNTLGCFKIEKVTLPPKLIAAPAPAESK